MTLTYDRLVTLRVINRSQELADIYLEKCTTTDREAAIQWMFFHSIRDTQYEVIYRAQGGIEKMENKALKVPFYDKPQIEVAALIEKLGWKDFKAAIVRYALRRADILTFRGDTMGSERWSNIANRMDHIPKNVH